MRRGTLCRLALVVVLTVGGLSARAGADPPCRAEAPDWPLPGSSWVLARTATGSFGSASHAVTIDLLGEQVWRGRRVMVLREGPVRTYLDMRYRLLALEHGGRMQAVYEPFDPLFAWPLVVGRQWTGEYYVTGASGGSPRLMRFAYRVDALEEATVPAGRFVAFRVRRHDATETIVYWWSPELGIPIKMTRERSRFDPLGPGSLLEELRSWRFNPGDEP